jgi:hypothetical protein
MAHVPEVPLDAVCPIRDDIHHRVRHLLATLLPPATCGRPSS